MSELAHPWSPHLKNLTMYENTTPAKCSGFSARGIVTSPCTLNVSWSAKSSGCGSTVAAFACYWIYWQFEWRVQCVRALLWQPTAPHESWVSASLSSFDMALSTGDPSTPWHCMPYVLQCLAQEIYSTLQPVTNSTLPYLASNFSQLSLSDKGAFWLGPGHKISHKCVAV